MLTFLPFAFFAVLFLFLLGTLEEDGYRSSGWRGVFLQACVIWGAIVAISSELLGLLNAITKTWLGILWGVSLLLILFLGARQIDFRQVRRRLKGFSWRSCNWADRIILITLSAIVLYILVLAWKVVPNNTDSMFYHMSRVMHWMQNKNLNHYSTQNQNQIFAPPWAEMAILHLRTLSGTDQIANLVQWFSMAGSLVGISLIAGLLGASVREQVLAAFFVVSIPMGLLQATSTQNDYVTSFWLVCITYFVVLAKARSLKRSERLLFVVAAGLGMLTKGVFYFYALPILLWYFLPRLKTRRIRETLLEGVTLAVVVLVLNSGYLARNLLTYRAPFGPASFTSSVSESRLDPRMWIPAVMKQFLRNFISTIPKFNAVINSSVSAVEQGLGLEPTEYTLIPGWNHEDLAGNPLHMLLVLLTIFFLVVYWRRKEAKLAKRYGLVILCSFLVFAIILADVPYYIRFHLPFFVLWGAVFGALASFIELKKFVYLTPFLFVLSSIPWLLFNRTRSLIPLKPYTSLGGSVFKETSEVILFANWHMLREPYTSVTEAVKQTSCRDIGLRIDSHDLEYPYWRLLEAPESGIRIKTVDEYRYLERYLDRSFEPCAIICSICGDREEFRGLVRYGEFGEGVVLFIAPEDLRIDDG